MIICRMIYMVFIILLGTNAYAQDEMNYGTSNIVLGDVNADGAVDISDVLMTVDYILCKQQESFVIEAADMNRDNAIDISDVLMMVDKILGKEVPIDDDGTPHVGDDDANPNLPVLSPKR